MARELRIAADTEAREARRLAQQGDIEDAAARAAEHAVADRLQVEEAHLRDINRPKRKAEEAQKRIADLEADNKTARKEIEKSRLEAAEAKRKAEESRKEAEELRRAGDSFPPRAEDNWRP